MMQSLLIAYCVMASTLVVLLLAALAVGVVRAQRQRSRNAVLRSRYLHIVMLSLYTGDEQTPSFPMIGRLGAKLLLVETLAGVASATYGLDASLFRRIVVRYGLERWLLRRIRWSQGFRRARYLSLLAALPVDEQTASGVVRYALSRNRYVRFYTLMVRLAFDPTAALRLMSDYGVSFSGCEVAEIMSLLRRGMLPIAYESLINSSSRNLRLVGLGVVRQFGIEEAEPLLLHMVARDEAPELGREALYTLCSMRRSLAWREVASRVASMGVAEQRALLRYMAQEGYSSETMRAIFDKREQPYFESLVHSYKRCLA